MIGNSNTGRLHEIGCRAIDMMKENHKVETEDGAGFTTCGWCKASGVGGPRPRSRDRSHQATLDSDVPWPLAEELLSRGCIHCGTKHDGIVYKYPHSDGELLEDGCRYWIYMECEECGHETSLVKSRGLLRDRNYKP